MDFIGVYTKNSTILLELLNIDEDNAPIPADFPPTASLEYYDGDRLTIVQHVTLESIGPGRYLKAIFVSDDWGYGDYLVTYEATLNGVTSTTKERFQVRSGYASGAAPSAPVLVSDITVLTSNGGYTTVMMNGLPMPNAKVNIYAVSSGELVAKASTDSGGHWSTQAYPGTYKFEFVHPNGTILRTLEKAVK
ncbi:hypothetical protein SAMN02799624_05212 [Paenibacillus sp. UNC496MF]|uniref:hypothetical protein n=1 Tax=Paenibacillus sp. UNC496MF TaxID=1502753 RepID=UPI0008E55245|nr:hypothetical protein [Paenibacillus sp. UNC496MF]SFJ62179.1 hypothetical protein SAMN02799624_05212 [Paenibacillus sp. UNC496MF]